jgi:two-component system, chemotaxis family, CheB/CheR fusion protein
LPPADAVALCAAIHELTDNAARHGSLSRRGGKLEVAWRMVRLKGRNAVRIDWRESGGPAVRRPRRKGFGTRLIEHAVKTQLGGTIVLDYAASGVRARISIPMKVHADGEAGV